VRVEAAPTRKPHERSWRQILWLLARGQTATAIAAQLPHSATLQRQPDRIRSTTCFHWWPKPIHNRRGPR